jgi:hypothetical protein
LLSDPPRLVVVGGRMNAFGCGAGVADVAGWLSADPCAAVARARCASRRATSALLITIAEAQAPRAAQRLRNHGGWAGARVIAEAEVPPAAQRLRNHLGLRVIPPLGALPSAHRPGTAPTRAIPIVAGMVIDRRHNPSGRGPGGWGRRA